MLEQVIIAHLSDLHFGRGLIGWVRRNWHDFRFFSGLPSALENARVRTGLGFEDPLYVAVTGDLTHTGHPAEFALAHTYLRNAIHVRVIAPRAVGLVVPEDELRTVPGNHDHWEGKPWLLSEAASVEGIRSHFEPTPWRKVWPSANGGLRVSLFGVDSMSGLPGVVGSGAWAVGRISGAEIKQLRGLLEADLDEGVRSGATCVRAILCHHSILYEDDRGGGWNQLDRDSRIELVELAAEFGVSAILTGDIHEFDWGSLGAFTRSGAELPWEFRSAATLTRHRPSGKKPLPEAGFWIHQIRLRQGHPDWHAWRVAWTGVQFQMDDEPVSLRA